MAIDTIKSTAVLDGAIATADIADDAVTSAKIADDAVTSAKLDTNLSVDGTLGVGGNLTQGNTAQAIDGLGVQVAKNITFAEGATNAFANIFRQSSSGSLVLGQGYQYHANANQMASSVGISWAKNAIGVSSGNGIQFFCDAAGTVAKGTAIVPTEIARITTAGLHIGGTGSANALDDYEEGSFTPNIGGSGVSYGTQTGLYRKVGSMVFIYLDLSISTIGSPATTSSIQGLPFAPATSNQHFGIAYAGGLTNSYYALWGNFRTDSTIRFDRKNTLGTGQGSGIAVWQNGAAIYGSGMYITSA